MTSTRVTGHRARGMWVLVLAALSPLLLAGCITVTDRGAPDGSPTGSLPAGPAASTGGSPGASMTPTGPTPEPTPPPPDVTVVGFLPNWLVEDAATAIEPDLLDILALHSIEASGNGRLVSEKPSGDVPDGWARLDDPAFAALKARAQAAGAKVVITIGRMGWAEGTLERTRALLGSARFRSGLATRIASFVEERGFDGVNLDVEPVPEELADEYVELVRAVRAALDEVDPGLHLSVDVLPSLTGYDLAGLTGEGAADLAIIMGYNFRGPGAQVAGPTAPLHDPESGDLATAVEAALAQVPGDRLALALPWYGVAWPTESDEQGSATISGRGIDGPASPPYAEAVTRAAETGRRYDPDRVAAWTAYPTRQCSTCPAVWRQLWYDDPDSFGAKVDHALERGLAGVGIWALGQEAGREELWSALRQRLAPMLDEEPPAGSASLDPETITGDMDGVDIVEGSASLLLFAGDDPAGSGIALARVGLDGEVDADGRLVDGVDYPAVERITFPLGDEATGGSAEDGPRTIHVQWRDIAGNWSPPIVIDAWAIDPVGAATPDDL